MTEKVREEDEGLLPHFFIFSVRMKSMKITIYTDGSSRGNPGPGGWGAIVLLDNRTQSTDNRHDVGSGRYEEVIELGGREDMTTNNRMELMSAIEGLRHVNHHHPATLHVEVCTDSQYVKKGMTEWIQGWIKKGWKNSLKKDVLNRDLWEALLHEETRLKHTGAAITWKYVPGHSGVPLNERADAIATGSADNASHLQLYRGAYNDYPYLS